MEWVLESVYGLARTDILQALRRLFSADDFDFANRGAVAIAIQRYAAGKADFSDYLIGESATLAGASVTYTFDRELARAPGFSRPG